MGSGARTATAGVRVALRPATASDIPEVAALERVCYSDPWPATAFASLPDNDQVFFGIARDEGSGTLLGYAVAWFVLDEGELANLAVAPQGRRHGIGSRILAQVIRDAEERGTRNLYLEVRESNAAARLLYQGREFKEVGRRKSYYRSPTEDALILRRTLKP